MANNRVKYYDTHTLYVTSGVAREDQLNKSLKEAIKNGEETLYNEDLEDFIFDIGGLDDIPDFDNLADKNNYLKTKIIELGYEPPTRRNLTTCKIKVNLIFNKSGDYYGFGYIHVSREDVYWMLLGKNPDGTDRVLEYLDPDWVPPLPKPELTQEQEQERYSSMKWYEIAEEEDNYVHPTIRQILKPLMPVPGYEYDELQYRHHQEVAKRDGKDPTKVPKTGYFEFSRAYARDVDSGKMENVLCARQVPDWIPPFVFKQIFKYYVSDSVKTITNEDGTEDTYPIVNLIDGKREGGRIVFVAFEGGTKDAIFALLMTRKVHIVHPKNPSLKCTLIFDHAYERGNSNNQDRNNQSNTEKTERNTEKPERNWNSRRNKTNRDDVDISKYNYTKKK